MTRRFHLHFLYGTALSIAVLVFFLNRAQARFYPLTRQDAPRTVIEGLDPRYVVPKVTSGAEAKKRGLFYVSRDDIHGVGLRLLQNRDLFDSAFPGYEEALSDEAFWERYFSFSFDSNGLWLPSLNQALPERFVSYSWRGCTEMFRKYGANVLFAGTSQVFRGIIPKLVQQQLGPKKILMCAKPLLSVDGIGVMASHLSATGRRADVVVWGYPLWSAAETTEADDAASTKALLEELTAPPVLTSRWTKFWSSKLSDFFPKPDWEQFQALSYGVIAASRPDAPKDDSGLPENLVLDRKSTKPWHVGFWFSNELANDAKAIEELAFQSPSTYDRIKNLSERSCDLRAVDARFQRAVDALLNVAENVVVYLAPVPPDLIRWVPPCVLDGVTRILSSRASRRIRVLTDAWEIYGLDYTDFILRFTGTGAARFDPTHTNYRGAEKVSRKLASVIRPLLHHPRGLANHEESAK